MLLLARIEEGARIVFVQPENTRALHALSRAHGRRSAKPVAIGVRDRRTEDIDVRTRQQRLQRIVAARRRTVAQRRKFKAIAVEEEHQFLAAGCASAGGREGCHEIRHLALLEAGEFNQPRFACRVAQQAVRMAATLLRRGRFGCGPRRIAALLQPVAERGARC